MTELVYPEMIGLREAASRTGLSYDWLRKSCLEGKIIHIKVGKKFLVNFGKLCEFLEQGENSSI